MALEPTAFRPDSISLWLFGALVAKRDREAIVGDALELAAEQPTKALARRAFRRQLLVSAPHLLLRRIQSSRVFTLAVLIALTYPLVLIWWQLVFGLFRLLYTTNIFQGWIGLALTVRLALEASGYLIAGLAVAWLLQRLKLKPMKRFLLLMGWLILAGPTMLTLLLGTHQIPMVFLVARVIIIIPLLVYGYRIGQQRFQYPTQ